MRAGTGNRRVALPLVQEESSNAGLHTYMRRGQLPSDAGLSSACQASLASLVGMIMAVALTTAIVVSLLALTTAVAVSLLAVAALRIRRWSPC
jgi:hypothetical protein